MATEDANQQMLGTASPPQICGVSHMNLLLRPAVSSDCDAIADILIRTRTAFMPYAPSVHSEPKVHRWVQGHLIPSGGVTLATHSNAIVGVIAVSNDIKYNWIDQMYVTPPHVSKGIGARLLEHALTVLHRPIRLYTFQANAGARRFYERHGFCAIEFSDGLGNEEKCPDVLYELNLADNNAG
jgi:GNAT superfamily N-acetyltransferase